MAKPLGGSCKAEEQRPQTSASGRRVAEEQAHRKTQANLGGRPLGEGELMTHATDMTKDYRLAVDDEEYPDLLWDEEEEEWGYEAEDEEEEDF